MSFLRFSKSTKRHFSSSLKLSGKFTDYVASLKIPEISPLQLRERMAKDNFDGFPKGFHLIDVRETIEWNSDHIPYAIYTGKGNLERDIEALVPNPSDEIVLYCAGGMKSKIAASNLIKMGYTNVKSLETGIGGWKKDGNPIIVNSPVWSERQHYGYST